MEVSKAGAPLGITFIHSLLFALIPPLTVLREQARNQNSMYMRQLSDLESTVSQLRSELREAKRMYEDKVSLFFAASRDYYTQNQLCSFLYSLYSVYIT